MTNEDDRARVRRAELRLEGALAAERALEAAAPQLTDEELARRCATTRVLNVWPLARRLGTGRPGLRHHLPGIVGSLPVVSPLAAACHVVACAEAGETIDDQFPAAELVRALSSAGARHSDVVTSAIKPESLLRASLSSDEPIPRQWVHKMPPSPELAKRLLNEVLTLPTKGPGAPARQDVVRDLVAAGPPMVHAIESALERRDLERAHTLRLRDALDGLRPASGEGLLEIEPAPDETWPHAFAKQYREHGGAFVEAAVSSLLDGTYAAERSAKDRRVYQDRLRAWLYEEAPAAAAPLARNTRTKKGYAAREEIFFRELLHGVGPEAVPVAYRGEIPLRPRRAQIEAMTALEAIAEAETGGFEDGPILGAWLQLKKKASVSWQMVASQHGVAAILTQAGKRNLAGLMAEGRFGCFADSGRPCGGQANGPCKHGMTLLVGLRNLVIEPTKAIALFERAVGSKADRSSGFERELRGAAATDAVFVSTADEHLPLWIG